MEHPLALLQIANDDKSCASNSNSLQAMSSTIAPTISRTRWTNYISEFDLLSGHTLHIYSFEARR